MANTDGLLIPSAKPFTFSPACDLILLLNKKKDGEIIDRMEAELFCVSLKGTDEIAWGKAEERDPTIVMRRRFAP